MYTLAHIFFPNTKPSCVIRTSDGACIPFDPANTDATEFCKWLKAGNIPEALDDGTVPTQDEVNAIIAKLS
jgi:hypothetical protein